MPMSWNYCPGVSGTKIMQEKRACFDKLYALQNGRCHFCGEIMLPDGQPIVLHHTDPTEYKTSKYYDYVNDIENRFHLVHRQCHNAEHKRIGRRGRPKMTEEERKVRYQAKKERQKEQRRLYRLENPLPPRPPRAPFVPWNRGLKTGPLSPEHKQKISEAKSGANCSPETRQKLSKAAKGKPSPLRGKPGHPQTEETRRKISEAIKAKGIRPSVRQKSA